MRNPWIPFIPYALVSTVHLGAILVGADALIHPAAIARMPLLAFGVVLALRSAIKSGSGLLLLAAIALSWLGGESTSMFPGRLGLPMMILFFGLAHLAYIWLFGRRLARRRVPRWALVYAAWWVAIIGVLWPHLGGLAIAVAVYGLVLGGTAVTASRCNPLIAWGGAVFLLSDTFLSIVLFLPGAGAGWAFPLAMLTYNSGQGLLAIGTVIALRALSARTDGDTSDAVHAADGIEGQSLPEGAPQNV